MTKHETATVEIVERVSLYALGALDEAEAREFSEHLIAGCAACAAEVRAMQETAALIPMGLDTARPGAAVREKLFERIGSAGTPPFKVVREGEGDWHALPFPGVTVKRLHHNRGGDITMLIRMERGAKFPGHPHRHGEHCYVLEGDIHFGDLVMGPGDYQWASGETDHVTSYTGNGCLLLMIVSEANAKLAAPRPAWSSESR